MTSGKALLIAGGVAVGAYLLLELVRGSTKPATSSPGSINNSDYALISGLVNIGAKVASSISSSPSSAPQPAPVYVIGEGYIQGGASAPIDATTGGVVLPAGEIYGPFES